MIPRIGKDCIKNIIKAGVRAPSNDNSQPWRFEVSENKIDTYLVERGNSYMDCKHFGSHIGHGALVENMCIAARFYGYESAVTLFPSKNNSCHTASIRLIEASRAKQDSSNHLYDALFKRVTHRSKPLNKSLSKTERNTLTEVPKEFGDEVRLVLVDDKAVFSSIARSVVVQIKILFSTKRIHSEFYSQVHTSKKEAKASGIGMTTEQLELSFYKRFIFSYVISRWWVVACLRFFGIQNILAWFEKPQYTTAGAYIGIVAKRDDPEMHIHAGRLMERVWLEATHLGLGVQPTFASVIQERMLNYPDLATIFSKRQKKLLNKTARDLDTIIGVEQDEHLLVLLRVGKHRKTPPLSYRKDPSIIFY